MTREGFPGKIQGTSQGTRHRTQGTRFAYKQLLCNEPCTLCLFIYDAKTLCGKIVEIIKPDESVVGLAVGGSWLQNELDEFSDLDLVILTRDKVSGDKNKMLKEFRRGILERFVFHRNLQRHIHHIERIGSHPTGTISLLKLEVS